MQVFSLYCGMKKTALSGRLFRMEVRRIELLSEDSVAWFSPSAGRVLKFPRPHAPCRACGFGSFMVPGYGKAYIAPFPTSMTPVA